MNVPTPKKQIRLSASAITTLHECSTRFWYQYVLKLPQGDTHPKTLLGSAVHSVLECLRNPRHRATCNLISIDPFDHTRSPAVVKLLRAWQTKHGISDEIMEPANELLKVGILGTNYHHAGAIKVYPPEFSFTLPLGDGDPNDPNTPVIRGFIDSLAEYEDGFLITDYKTSGQKFTKVDVPAKIQGLVYQLAIWKTFRKRARVQFVFLRHGPTPRTPDKHVQIVEPLTPDQLAGFEAYLISLYRTVNHFGEREALASPNPDHFFCDRICPYLRPFSYWVAIPKDSPSPETAIPVKSYLMVDKPGPNLYDSATEVVVERRHGGCAAKWRQ